MHYVTYRPTDFNSVVFVVENPISLIVEPPHILLWKSQCVVLLGILYTLPHSPRTVSNALSDLLTARGIDASVTAVQGYYYVGGTRVFPSPSFFPRDWSPDDDL